MTAHSRSDATIGRGYADDKCPNKRRHVLRIDDETFDEVRALAVRTNRSLNEQFRILIEWGLEAEGQRAA